MFQLTDIQTLVPVTLEIRKELVFTVIFVDLEVAGRKSPPPLTAWNTFGSELII